FVFTVTKSGPSAVTTTVNYTTTDGTATSSNDYVTTSGTITFTADQTQALITVTVTNDAIFENNETFTIDLSNAVNGTITDNQGLGTITDNADLPTIAVNDVIVSESDGALIFTITKTGSTLQTATLHYTTNDGSATGSNDFTADSGNITFTAGQTLAYVTIAITNDVIFEGTETFTLDLSAPVNATISDNQAIGTITNDDAAPTITLNDVTANEEAGTFVFTVTKSGPSAVTTTVNYTTTDGTATSSNDYVTTSGTITFTADQTQALITVTVTNDAVFENNETFTIDLSNAVNGTITDNQGLGTITDNADLPTIAVNDVTVSESDGALIFTITKTGSTLQTATLHYTTNDGSATGSNDFTADSGNITFTAGQTLAYVTIAITNDVNFEGTETFTLDLSAPVNATISDNQAIGTITNDDAAPTITLNDVTANEEAGTFVFTVTKSGPSAVTTTVNYTTSDGSATSSNDYVATSGTITFTADQTQALITVTVTNDAIFENNETFTIDLSNAVNGTITDNQGLGTITDNADLPTIAVNDVIVSESDGALIFTITKTGSTLQTATLHYTTNDGSATGSNDFTADSGNITFTAGQTLAYVTIAITNDVIFEGTETFTLDLSAPVNATISDNQAIGTITNDDAAPTITLNDVTANEEAGTFVFTVTKSGPSAVTTTVNYTTTDGTATSSNDYVTTSGTITFTADQTQALITVTVTNDAVFENNETFTIDLSNAVNGTITDNQGLGTITDNADLPTIAVNDVTVSESDGALIFTITKTGSTLQTATLHYTTNDGSATGSNDFTADSGNITFTAGQTLAYVTIAITNDVNFEGTETFTLDLSAPVNATISDNQAIGTITNDDAAPTITLNDVTANEEAGTFVFTVTKSGPSAVTTTVNYTTSDGSATSSNDYVATSGTITFTADQTQALITVTVTNDAIFENNETFTIDLSNAVNGTITDNQGLGTITDNADLPTIAVNDVIVSESDGALIFTITKTGSTLQTATLHYTTNDGSATGSNDFTADSGNITFTAGQTLAYVTIAITNDVNFEGTETFTLDLSAPVNATISDNQAIGTITNDDAAPTITLNDVTANEEAGTFVFTVTKSGPSAVTTTVNYTTSDGSATSSNDYVATSGTITFTADQTQALITVTVTNDAIFENNETFTIDLSNAVNGTITDNQGLGTITDNADLPTIAVNDVIVSESDGALIFTITKTGSTLQTATLHYTTNDGSATGSNDFTADSGNITFTAGQTLAYVTIAITNDVIFEGTETFTLDLSAPVNATISDNQAIGTITNDDAAPTITLNDVTANEEAGTFVFTVTKSGPSAVTTTVNYTTSDGSATSSNDYVATSGTITFTADQTQALITVTVTNDAIFENNETFTIDLSNAVNGTITDNQGLGTITDNADLPTIAVNDVTVSESDGALIFTITKTGSTLQTATLHYTTNDGSATGSNDFTADSGNITFTAGQTLAYVTIAITNDVNFEGTETFTLDLSAPVNATISDNQAIGTITNDDAAPTITLNDVTANEEAGTFVFTVTKSGPSAVTTTVNYTTTDGTATSSNDYVTTSGTITFTADQTQALITVTVTNDAIFENNETFTIDLSNAVNGTITDNQGLGTITDNADLPTIAVNDVTVSESDGALIFTITKTGSTLQTATLHYTTNDGSATGSNDFTADSGNITFTAGQTLAYVTIAITNDVIFEGTETFTLDLSAPVNATISDNQAIGTITNDDAAPTITINDVTANEEAGTFVFTVTKSGPSAVTTTVNYTTTDGTATSSNDYVATSGTITFTADQTQALITVTVTNDAVFENN